MESAPQRRNSVESLDSNASLGSNDTFQGEMDNFLEELRQKRKSADVPIKKDIDEDNISEEKVKRELNENEKGDQQPSPEPDRDRADSPWSDDSAQGLSSPEPEVDVPAPVSTSLVRISPVSTAPGPAESDDMENDPERAPSRQSDSCDDDDEVEDYDMTEDQHQAMLELQQMKLDLQDVGYTEEDPPEYDVAERVRQLNEELANDPTPLDDDRARSIKFKDDLVDLVAPPPDYPSDEEESAKASGGGGGGGGGGNVSDLNLNQMNLAEKRQGEGAGDGDGSSARPTRASGGVSFDDKPGVNVVGGGGGGSGGGGDGESGNKEQLSNGHVKAESNADEEKVLVQRGKTFELISASDLTAEERDIFLPPPDDDDDNLDGEPVSVSAPGGRPASTTGGTGPDPSFQPTPPREPRPATASGTSHRRPIAPQPRRRAQSAVPARKTHHGGVELDNSYQSPYAQSAELKKLGERQQRHKVERTRQEKQLERMKEEQKQRENEDAFLCWLKNKRMTGAWRREASQDDQSQEKKKDEKVHNDDASSQDKESAAAFQEWLKAKKAQQRREKQVEEQRQQEEEQAWYDRPRQECDKAFRQYVFNEWLKKKNQDTKKAKKQEVARARINKLLVRRTRKAMQLARAIRQSQSFRYVDYYGYRC